MIRLALAIAFIGVFSLTLWALVFILTRVFSINKDSNNQNSNKKEKNERL